MIYIKTLRRGRFKVVALEKRVKYFFCLSYNSSFSENQCLHLDNYMYSNCCIKQQ